MLPRLRAPAAEGAVMSSPFNRRDFLARPAAVGAASLAANDRDRWLPLFWGLDNFKGSQATNRTQNNGWMMGPVDEAHVPPAHQARQRFIAAMDDWDEEGSDRAVAGLVRTAGATEVVELFWRYGARDFRDI